MPTPAKLSDRQLRADLAAGLTTVEIAAKYGVTTQAIRMRKHRAGILPAPDSDAQQEVARQAAIDELLVSHHRARLLQDACDAWLRDPDQPERYLLAPRAEELVVVYTQQEADGQPRRAKATLAALLARVDPSVTVDSISSLAADPRELLLKTTHQVRAIMAAAGGVARIVADARAIHRFQTALLNAVENASPEIANAIREAIRSADLPPLPGGPDTAPGDQRALPQ